MTITPRVSVLLAVYNGERHLEESLRSVLNQRFTDFELIVVDDGSTDRTPGILGAAASADPRVVIVRQENRGLTASLIRAMTTARGEYLARQDADDISPPERFQRQVDYLDAHPSVAALGTWADVIDGSGAVVGVLKPASGARAIERGLWTLRSTLVHGSMMMRKQSLEAVGGYREAFRLCQDYDLWLRLITRFDLDNLPDALNQWRMDRGGLYATRRAAQLKYAGLALAFAQERARYGHDSYEDFRRHRGTLDEFVAHYRMGPFVHAAWGELLLSGTGNSPAVRAHFRQALTGGHVRPRTVGLFIWTHLRLPRPGAGPLVLPDATEAPETSARGHEA